MMIKWLGHASFLIKTLDKRIYIDPYAGDYTEKAYVILITHGLPTSRVSYPFSLFLAFK